MNIFCELDFISFEYLTLDMVCKYSVGIYDFLANKFHDRRILKDVRVEIVCHLSSVKSI